MRAVPQHEKPPLRHHNGAKADPVYHLALSGVVYVYGEPPAVCSRSDTLYKCCFGAVAVDIGKPVTAPAALYERAHIIRQRFGVDYLPAVVFLQHHNAFVAACNADQRRRMSRAVAAEVKPAYAENDIIGRLVQQVRLRIIGEIGIDNALRRDPPPPYIALVEHALELCAVALLYPLRQGKIVVHREMEIEQTLFPALVYPFGLEPMLRIGGITVEPESRILCLSAHQNMRRAR